MGLDPPDKTLSHFEVLGVPATFAHDADELEKKFRGLSIKLHPDRFARKDPVERKNALAWTTALNDAYRALKDPVRRAEYLLSRAGFLLEKQDLGHAFLEEAMDDRERLAEAKASSPVEVERLHAVVLAKRDAALRTIAEAFALFERTRDRAALDVAANKLARLRYHQRFLDEVEGKIHA